MRMENGRLPYVLHHGNKKEKTKTKSNFSKFFFFRNSCPKNVTKKISCRQFYRIGIKSSLSVLRSPAGPPYCIARARCAQLL